MSATVLPKPPVGFRKLLDIIDIKEAEAWLLPITSSILPPRDVIAIIVHYCHDPLQLFAFSRKHCGIISPLTKIINIPLPLPSRMIESSAVDKDDVDDDGDKYELPFQCSVVHHDDIIYITDRSYARPSTTLWQYHIPTKTFSKHDDDIPIREPNQFNNFMNLVSARQFHVSVPLYHPRRIMVIGHDRDESSHGEIFDIDSATWMLLTPPMWVLRSSCTAVTYQNRVYVFGGYDAALHSQLSATKVCEMYEEIDVKSAGSSSSSGSSSNDDHKRSGGQKKQGVWKKITPAPIARANACGVVVDDSILVLGGEDFVYEDGEHQTRELATIDAYHPGRNTWRTLSWTLPFPTNQLGARYHSSTQSLMIVTPRGVYTRQRPFDKHQWIHHRDVGVVEPFGFPAAFCP